MVRIQRYIIGWLVAVLLVAPLLTKMNVARAAATFVVNTTADGVDANPGDAVCEITPAGGDCSLRAAIEEANALSGADTINFNLSGAADFVGTIGDDGYSISTNTPLPSITEQVLINGYSQNLSFANSAVSPAPLDGQLLVKIDGSSQQNSTYNNVGCITIQSTNVEVRGLIISNCGNDGINLFRADYSIITGNYIGTDETGLLDQGNGRDNVTTCLGSGVSSVATNHLRIGGTNAADRNVVAGNQCDDIFIHNEGDDSNPSSDNSIQGNYVGLGADGLTAIPAGYAPGLGNAILFGNSSNDLIGGTAVGATNVVGSSKEFGLSFRDGCSGTTIQGNYIGTDYTGNATVTHSLGTGNINSAIHIFGLLSNPGFTVSHDFQVGGTTSAARNVIAGNTYPNGSWEPDGVSLEEGTYNNVIEGNYIGVGADGITALGNQGNGVHITGDSFDNIVGGPNANQSNVIANNGRSGILIHGDQSVANALLHNVIYQNGSLGIDLSSGNLNTGDGVTAPTPNTPVHIGPNDLLNFPIAQSVTEAAGDTTVDYQLDVPAGQYLVEFYSNVAADPSGQGEGETYLGSDLVTAIGNGSQGYLVTFTGATGVTNLAMTVTEVRNDTPSGYGSTSEYGATLPPQTDLRISKVVNNPAQVRAGSDMSYTITLTNLGYSSLDLSQFDGSGFNPIATAIFSDFMPPDLTFVSSSNPNIACVDAGTLPTNPFPNHADYHYIFCVYAGPAQNLAPGDAISTNITATVSANSSMQFTNYVISGMPATDPDTTQLGNILTNTYIANVNTPGSADLIDVLSQENITNFAAAQYPVPVASNDNNPTTGDDLADTGENFYRLVTLALSLLLVGGTLLAVTSRANKRSRFGG